MESRKITYAILFAAISIIVIAGVLMPVLNESSGYFKEKKMHENIGSYYFNKVESATIDMVLGESFSVTVNGSPVSIDDYGIILMTDTIAVATGNQGEMFAFDPTNNNFIAGGATEGTATITIGSGQYTITTGGNTISGTTNHVLVAGTTGDYVQSKSFVANSNKPIIAYVGGILWTSEQGNVVINKPSTGSQSYPLKTITDFVVTGSTDSVLKWEVYNNNNESYDITGFSVTDRPDISILVYAPVSYYTMENTSSNNVLAVIPVMLIVVVILGITSVMFIKRE